MVIFKQEIHTRIQFLRQVIRKKEACLTDIPEGTLNIIHSGGRIQYYLYQNGRKKYLKANDMELGRCACQKEYDRKVLQAARQELKYLEKLEAIYQETGTMVPCDAIYEKLSEERRALLKPLKITDEEYRKQWEAAPYKKKELRDDFPAFFTNKGEQLVITHETGKSPLDVRIVEALVEHYFV